MKTTRLKAQPITSKAEFDEQVAALLQLETEKRKIEAERDAALLTINAQFDERVAPILAEIKGRLALTADYAEDHAAELLPDKTARSFRVATARCGWRRGNRSVATKSGVTVEQAINALKALGLESYVRLKEEIAKDAILADCKDNKTLHRVVRDPAGEIVIVDGQPKTQPVPLGDAGLKISQGESFFIEPESDSAETLTPAAAAA